MSRALFFTPYSARSSYPLPFPEVLRINPLNFFPFSAYSFSSLSGNLNSEPNTLAFFALLGLLACTPWSAYSDQRLSGAHDPGPQRFGHRQLVYCLDGSLPAYHLDRGFGPGARNWLLQFEGGGWCNDPELCMDRAKSRRGSTDYMSKFEVFSGILSNNASHNPDFYNWNRVKLRYCDGASFAGDSKFSNGTSLLYFRGQRIWKAIILDLLPKGLGRAGKALLSGCSAGGLATFLHCDNFTSYLPRNADVKCLSDAGFFLDIRDISLNSSIRTFYEDLISLQFKRKCLTWAPNLLINALISCYCILFFIIDIVVGQGVEQNLDNNCTSSRYLPEQCFFPQYALKYIQTPFFVLNSAYDVYQFHHILVPPSADKHGKWNRCKLDPAACSPDKINILQGFRKDMLAVLREFLEYSRTGGLFINSCFAHCQSESQDTWFAVDSPRMHNKTIAEAVGDWYFGRRVSKEIDCAYPCDSTCHNLIGQVPNKTRHAIRFGTLE
ncbi:hypothetical protein RJ639_015099 [Escallonia herrerae]|uniref:Pectin acetylesterase n=1 Tax=Escallonia herrerae TaxID=1293975 RepID=A0AA89ANM0_9ASTE|nr:hypothetical protein RJ639_015099 [Escallonia herrerae]